MKILLFGNKGQVGREVEDLAIKKGWQVDGFDVDSLDITDINSLSELFSGKVDYDVAINASAYTLVDKAEEESDAAFAVNCDGVRNLAKFCGKHNLPLLHMSTDYVFDGRKNDPYSEEDATNPLGVYGESKLMGEKALAEFCPAHIILRTSWVFGKYGNNFVKTILRLASEREEINIVGDQYGCPTAARDLARVLLELAEKVCCGRSLWGVYHYCGLSITTWFDFAKKIVEEAAKSKSSLKVQRINRITTNDYPTKAIRPQNSELLVEKITKDYGVEKT